MLADSPAIEVRDLRKVYGHGEGAKAAVDGLSLTVPQGSFFGFLGPNGAGKTTTIKMLMGLATPTAGTIRLLGLPMPEQAIDIKQQKRQMPTRGVRYGAIDFAAIAQGFGCRSWRAANASELDRALDEAFAGDGPALIDVQVDPGAYPRQIEAMRG